MAAPKAFSTRSLTKHLNDLGRQVHDMLPDGTPVTREEALARLLWDMALGYKEQTRDDEGNLKEIVHKPVAWAMQAVWDRKEGRAAPTVLEDENRVRAADKVRDLAKNRVNQLASAAAGPKPDAKPAVRPPPKFKPKPKQ